MVATTADVPDARFSRLWSLLLLADELTAVLPLVVGRGACSVVGVNFFRLTAAVAVTW
jgi:hypothetical protein